MNSSGEVTMWVSLLRQGFFSLSTTSPALSLAKGRVT